MKDRRHTAHRPPGPGNRWELVWSHRDELLEIALRRSSSAEEAEDAVQEAMLRAVEDPGVPYGRLGPWLRRATVRECAERHRQVARDTEAGRSPFAAPAEPRPVDEAACDRAEARWVAARSTEVLPARQAEALRLRSQGLDVGQVASAMGLSCRGAESLLARARRSLRSVLAGSVTLALTVWMSVRRFPRTGVTQSAVTASAAAVTAVTVGLSLPAAPPDRPDGPPPRAGAGAPRPVQHTEPAASRPAPPGRPHTPPPPPSPAAVGAGRDTPHPEPDRSSAPYEPRLAAAVRIRTDPVGLVSGLASATPRASVPSLPVDVPHLSATKPPPVTSGVATDGSAGVLPLQDVVSAR